MPKIERVTVTLPGDLVKDIDRRDTNRDRFIAEAVHREIDRRRREELHRSLQHPHPETIEFVDQGFDEWSRRLPNDDAQTLVDTSAGTPVRWVPGPGLGGRY